MPHPLVHNLTPARLRAAQMDAARAIGLLSPNFRDPLDNGLDGPELAMIPASVFDMGTCGEERGFGDLPRHHSSSITPLP